MNDQALVISLHDVAPHTQHIVTEQLEVLRRLGVSHCSLLVIPSYHHEGTILNAPSFIAWLQEKQEQGHEIVLHGYHHLRPVSSSDGLIKSWITQHYTAGEGEFYDLHYEEARRILKHGKEVLYQAGIDPKKMIGFIAPAWLLGGEAQRAVRDEGFSYTTRLKGLFHFQERRVDFFHAQSMVYSVRSAWRRCVSLAWNEFLFQDATVQQWPLLRISFHPMDWHYSSIQAHLLHSVKRSLRNRTPKTYASWLHQAIKDQSSYVQN